MGPKTDMAASAGSNWGSGDGAAETVAITVAKRRALSESCMVLSWGDEALEGCSAFQMFKSMI